MRLVQDEGVAEVRATPATEGGLLLSSGEVGRQKIPNLDYKDPRKKGCLSDKAKVHDARSAPRIGITARRFSPCSLPFLQLVTATRANFHEPSLCRFSTRRHLGWRLTGLSLEDILYVASR